MAQVTTGIRSILSRPLVYETLQKVMRTDKGRVGMVRDYIRPFPGMRILDLGCGTAEILRALPGDIIYVGYDMSPEYISVARQRFAGRGTFHCRMLERAEVTTLDPFDLVLGLGVLHHLDDDSALQFMGIARAALSGGGRIYTVDPCYAPGQSRVARCLISHDRGLHVRDAEGYRALTRDLAADVAGTLVHQSWVPYTRWHMVCRMRSTEMPIRAEATISALRGDA